MRYLGASFFTYRLNFNLCSKDSYPYTDKEYIEFREERNFKWLNPLLDRPDPTSEWQVEFPLDFTWIASFILLKIFKFKGLVEIGGARHAKVP